MNLKNLCTNIRSIRESKHFSQEYMGYELGISQSAYANLEAGKTVFSLERLSKVIIVLETSFSQILEIETIESYPQGIKNKNDLLEISSLYKEILELNSNSFEDLKKELSLIKKHLKIKSQI